MQNEYKDIVYHYTSLESALSIISKERVVLRAGRYDAMNDPDDSTYGITMSNKVLGGELADATIDTYLYDMSPYLVSFCKENDMPLMWRLYNAQVTLHIDTKVINEAFKENSNIIMDDVEYLPQDEAAMKVFDLFSEARKYFGRNKFSQEARVKSSFIKSDDFECEKEWRVVWIENFDSFDDNAEAKGLDGDDVASEIKVKGARYGAISFYRELKFPKESLVGITVKTHDNEDFLRIYIQLRLWLIKCGYDINKIDIQQTKTQRVR